MRKRTRFAILALLLACFGAGLLVQAQSPIALTNNRADVIVEFRRALHANERAQLQTQGLRFYQAIGSNRYLARISQKGLDAVRGHGLFARITPVTVNDKVVASIRTGNPARHARLPDGKISVMVQFYPDVEFGHAMSLLRRYGLTPQTGVTGFNLGGFLNAQGTQAQIIDLARTSFVQYVQETAPPAGLDNATAAMLSNVDDVQAAPYNLTGNGVNVGIWDGSPVWATHQDLTPRVTNMENNGDAFASQDHGTHVSGTIASSGANNATARGMATQATIFAFGFSDAGDEATEQQSAVDNQGIRASNHSWGPILGWDCGGGPPCTWSDTGNHNLFGAYEGRAVVWGTLVRNRPNLTVSKSSGNDDGDCDPSDATDCDGFFAPNGEAYDLIGTFGNAKNILTVGALNDDGTTKAGFSGTGPSDDGRIKPDIVANGVSLTSTCAGNMANDDDNYCSKGGTSMSTPTVTGIVALMIQHYRQRYGVTAAPSADIMKALLLNTATDLGRPGPDYRFGFGRADALAAAQTIDAGPVRIITDAVDNGQTDEYLLPVPGGAPSLRVTLNWIDPPGAGSTSDNEATADLVNNLDLELVAPDNSLRFPFTGPGRGNPTGNATNGGPNNIDNVEQAVVANPAQGFWKVRVRGTAVPQGPQNYALVSNVSFSLPGQPEIEVNAPLAFNEICMGQTEDRTVSIFNTGGGVLQISSITVGGSPAFSILSGPTPPFQIQPGAHVDLTIRFAPNAQNQNYNGTLTILSNDADEGSIVIPITGSTGAPLIDTLISANGNFGDVCREAHKDMTLTVNNSGSCPLNISNITSSSTDFTVATALTYPVTVGAGDSLEVPIRYKSSNLGLDNANITVTSNAENAPSRVVPVSGNAPPGDLKVSGSTDFGNVCAGVNAEKIVELCNLGLCNLNVTSVTLESLGGGVCNEFVIVNNPFATPAPISKDFCTPVTIRFTPTSVGLKQCNLRIVTDDPETPTVIKLVQGTVPAADLVAPANISYLPEVIQSVGACTSPKPWVVSNNGTCPVLVTDAAVSVGATDYSLLGKPETPIPVKPGHQLGEGDLKSIFGPTVLARQRTGTLSVTWEVDPITHATTTTNTNVCGEGVRTGARVLVTIGGVPAPTGTVEKIQLARITGNKNSQIVDSVSVAKDLPLTTVAPSGACLGFQYHREYGTVSNPLMLLPGSYRVTATAIVAGKRKNMTVSFDVSTCDFNPTVVVPF